MIQREIIHIDNIPYERIQSDLSVYIIKQGTDEKYACAYDVIDAEYEYYETDERIPEIIMNSER